MLLWGKVHSAYFQTSSAPRFRKLRRAAGISPEDLAAQGEEFLLYMTQSFLHAPDTPMAFPDPPGTAPEQGYAPEAAP